MRALKYIPLLAMVVLVLSGCNLEREIDLDLPPYTSEPVVECYLQPGQPIVLTVIRSVGFLDELQVIYEKGATVVISHGTWTDTLTPISVALPEDVPGQGPGLSILRPIIGDSLYFYLSPRTITETYDVPYKLTITTRSGEVLTSETVIRPPVPIKAIEYRPSQQNDSLYFTLTKFDDNPNEANFYRRVFQKGNVNDNPDQDFTVEDAVVNGQEVAFGTGFDYRVGDTLIATLYHITEDYYRFSQSVDAAFQANASPFAQPARIRSNIKGGMGIFTGFAFDRKQVIIE